MPQSITSLSITAPGFFGLNIQDSSVDLPAGFAQIANNCVIDTYGRLGSRKGWIKASLTNATLGNSNIAAIGELIGNDGTSYIICAGANKLFKLSGNNLVELPYSNSGPAPTITASNWQIATLNNVMYLFQRGHDALIFDPAVSATTYRRVSEKAGSTGTVPQANTAISAYGRIWCADTATDKNTVTWSDVLTGHVWATGGGSLNLANVWPNGADEIVAIAAHNNFLIIFGKRQIIIYGGANNPSSMALSDTISTIGCFARDTVQNTGSDLLFLSNSGVRSIQRTIQEKSSPLRDASKNIRDHIMTDAMAENVDNIKSVYSDVNSFYLITLPVSQETYCFDTRSALEDGAFRVTTWDLMPKCYFASRDKKLYMGFAGYLGEHTGYLDDAAAYLMEWYSTHANLGNSNRDSILKKINLVVMGGNGQQVNCYYGFNYSSSYLSSLVTLTKAGAGLSSWGVFEWGIGEWSSATALSNLTANIGGSGKIVQLGFSAVINGAQLSFQKIDLFAKVGKVIM